jgi:uncharacterized protein (TIGR02265 family)
MRQSNSPPNRKLVYQAGIESLLRGVDWDKQPGLREALVKAGYDPARPQREYPLEVAQRLMELLAERCFAGMNREDAFEQLGHQAFQGYRGTLTGRVVMAALHLANIPRCLQMVIRGFQSITNFTVHEVITESPTHLIYRTHHSGMPPRYTLGVLKELMGSAGHKSIRYDIDRAAMPEYVDFHLRW